MSFVFVVDQQRRPLDPVHPGRARFLLKAGRAAVFRRYPFTLILQESKPDVIPAPLRVKLDPGSQTTGIAIVNDAAGQVLWAAELTHRGQQVKSHLNQRRQYRRSRRNRHTRYRASRFKNRTRPPGWLPPSLVSLLDNILTWVHRLHKVAPIGAISQELVKFDTQRMQNAEIKGVEYQRGELAGFDVKEYLLAKFAYVCAYCGQRGVFLETEHIIPKSRGGTNRVSNLTVACHACNQAKGNQTAEEFGHPQVQAQAKAPLKDAATVNTTRWALYHRLGHLRMPIETGTGSMTAWHRAQQGLSKTHWLDATCVGASTPEFLQIAGIIPLLITAMGRHSRQMCRPNRYGFPNKAPKATSMVGGYRTGDIVCAKVPETSTKAGAYVGRIAIRANGYCDIKTATSTIQGIHVKYCHPLHRGDGYRYQKGACAFLPLP